MVRLHLIADTDDEVPVAFEVTRASVSEARVLPEMLEALFGASPAHAGMYPRTRNSPSSGTSFPRTRGDVPRILVAAQKTVQLPPHTRGCTPMRSSGASMRGASPAHAGMYRLSGSLSTRVISFPRTRGDVPRRARVAGDRPGLPPHTRGCTLGHGAIALSGRASPAHAGMYPFTMTGSPLKMGFPRTRGDVPSGCAERSCGAPLPPHTRGCTFRARLLSTLPRASPAHAGMYPART